MNPCHSSVGTYRCDTKISTIETGRQNTFHSVNTPGPINPTYAYAIKNLVNQEECGE